MIKLAFISQGRIYRGRALLPNLCSQEYTLIEQSSVYSNRTYLYVKNFISEVSQTVKK